MPFPAISSPFSDLFLRCYLDDYRLFVGDLGKDCTDANLTHAFAKYPSFLKARCVRDKRTNYAKYGFVSFKNAEDMVLALKEMNGKYVGNRPVKLRRSLYKERDMENQDEESVKELKRLKNIMKRGHK